MGRIYREIFAFCSVGLLLMTNTNDPEGTLRIEAILDSKLKSDLAMHSFVIAGLQLEERIVQSNIMQESSTYQLLRREARQEGLAQGMS
ncbi:MAG: hypothetical protein ACK4QL_01975 [Pseudanabaenaceae cyanobacterium]